MEKKKEVPKKQVNIRDITTCDATAQVLEKARQDGVETAFDRAANMKACPIGADSACCKHCALSAQCQRPVWQNRRLRCHD